MQDNKLIITHQDGSQNVVENPCLPMQATYAALAADPNAMPELSDESRTEILRQIASERHSGKMNWAAGMEKRMREEQERKEKDQREYGHVMNRHERRKQAKLARKDAK